MNENEKDDSLGPVDPEAPLWVMLPQLLQSIVISVGIILIVFWFTFGELSLFAFGFAAFLAVMQVLMVVGFRLQNRSDDQVAAPDKLSKLDMIGGCWLVACAFGAFFAWICGSLAPGFPGISSALYIAAAVLSIGLPVLTALPNLRYIGGKATYIQVPLIVIVTMLPVIEGCYYLRRIW